MIYQNNIHFELFPWWSWWKLFSWGCQGFSLKVGEACREAAEKVSVIALLKRNGKVYTAITPDAKTQALMQIIREKVKPE